MWDTVLSAIGHTPLVRLHSISRNHPGTFYVKCEFLNPGGSVKDRVALAMIEKAEREGRIRPGDTLIEATSGNAGIGLALVGAVKGYKVIVTMPDRMSLEKEALLKALGASVYRTPTHAPSESSEGYVGVARRLHQQIPRSHILDQYNNTANVDAHATTTAEEIWKDTQGSVHRVVAGIGTGGTLTGIAQRLRSYHPFLEVIGVEPHRSIFGGWSQAPQHYVEGIGSDFMPGIFDPAQMDQCIKVTDDEAFSMMRRLIREEGLLAGGSSGAAVHAALKTPLEEGQICVIILPDSSRNCMSML